MRNTARLQSATDIPSEPGTYALLLSSVKDREIHVGRLGTMRLRPGYYVYVGSALGPGGVRARLAHHLRLSRRPHWHIDYLRKELELQSVWCCYDSRPREHLWAKMFSRMRGASVPMPGFGSSDCKCESHLFFFEQAPRASALGRGAARVADRYGKSRRSNPRTSPVVLITLRIATDVRHGARTGV